MIGGFPLMRHLSIFGLFNGNLPARLRVCRTRVGARVEGEHTMTQIKKWTVVARTTSAPSRAYSDIQEPMGLRFLGQ